MKGKELTLARTPIQLRYTDTGGEGRALVFLHGAGLDRTIFDPQVKELAGAGWRVVTCDLPGHGRSTPPNHAWRFTAAGALEDLSALLDELELDAPVLIGHSLGGNLAQAYVRENPERIGGMIIMDSTWNTGPLTVIERLGLKLSEPILSLIPGKWLPGVSARASASNAEVRRWATTVYARMPKHHFIEAFGAATFFVTPDPSYLTPVPLALIKGEKDTTGNIVSAMTRWAQAEHIEEQTIVGAGHIVSLDAPRDTTEAIVATLARWWSDEAPEVGGGN